MNHQWWWLRSPGVNADYTAYVGAGNNRDARIDLIGDVAGNSAGAVRPALNLRFVEHTVGSSVNRTPSEEAAELEAISESGVGDVVVFGRYTWYVTDKTDGICTLLCQGCVADKASNDTKTGITWESCSLRKWLNNDFYNSKFSDGEKASIITIHNTFTEEDSPYGMNCGDDTDDKVYLFTYSESMSVSDNIRSCGIKWWLRSPGKKQNDAVYIFAGGSANLMGNEVDYTFGRQGSDQNRLPTG